VTINDTTPAEKEADKYEPKADPITKEKGNPVTEDEVKGKVTVPDYPADKTAPTITVDDPSKLPDGNTVGEFDVPVTVTYPDKTTDKTTVKVTITEPTAPAEKDADKYTPEGKDVEVEKDSAPKAEDSIANKDDLPAGTKYDWKETPDTSKTGETTGTVVVTYPDKSTDEVEVKVTVKDTTPSDKDTKISGDVKPVDPTDEKQDTGINVENKDDDTKISAKDEDGKDIPVIIDEDGNVIVIPGEDVDGPITVVVEDPELPGGKVEIEVPVIGHEKGRDDNGSGDHGYIPGDNDYFFPGRFKRHDYTPTYPVKTVVPEKTQAATPVRDTLWYVFHINEFEYEVVRNGVVTKRKMDVTPVLRNDRTMLPLRYVAEAIGAEVKWDKKTRTATFIKDGLTASIQIDSDEIVLSNGKTVKMDSKPLNINDRILVSVTNVANVFGLTNGNTQDKINQDIEWEQEDKSATIYIRR
ncbi:Rib/alpha-like domain-containing protein, partial [Peptoniphilus timonensis]|uniref:Rib/alpha-like domain-containing protein n=1 Tax=Peptoniphilus timonensis TaxID=1268254 RepID=UPI001FE223CD